MCSAVFSIKPIYVSRIFAKEKCFEFRKKLCKKSINRIFVYETAPISRIVGEVMVGGILQGTPEELWQITAHGAGLSIEDFSAYFKGCHYGVAYVLQEPICYSQPIKLFDVGVLSVPQSYCYISNGICNKIEELLALAE